MTNNLRKHWLRREVARLELEWEELLNPSPMGMFVNNYHRWPLAKLSHVVDIQDSVKDYKRELRRMWLAEMWAHIKGGLTR